MPEKSNNRVADEVTEAINRKSIKAENLMMGGLDLIEKFVTDLAKIRPEKINQKRAFDKDLKE